ncbi:protein PML-like isoform X2 [Haliotis rubra]|uniref:protein PML-like isoform X2 n=1 Tax=Haliotis rubra TaxID=36100 RepID=UPI001EE5E340|nr:protein PML-like isoform X2 [Haliotis rubra]
MFCVSAAFTLKGPAPYLLPCLHAVCETCVTSAAGGVISCSTCQREVNLKDTSLHKDTVRQKEIFHLTVKHRPTELLCTNDDDGNQAVCWCPECEDFLCEYCQNMHNSVKATRRHVVETIVDTAPGSMQAEPVCKLHKRYPLEYFDKSCNILICYKCRLGDHAEHDVGDVDVAADAAKVRIEQHGKNVTAHHTSHQAYLKSINKAVNDTKKTSSAVKETIHHTFHSLRTQLDQREKELIIDLDNQTKQELANLGIEQVTSEGESERCKFTSDYIKTVLRYASNSDFLTLESSIQETTKTHLRSVPPEVYSSPAAAFNTRGLDKLQSDISNFGSVVGEGSASDEHTLTDRGTQTDDIHLSDPEKTRKHKLAEVATETTPLLQFDAGTKTYSLETGTGTTLTLQCPKLQLDAARANTDECHVTKDGELVNSPPATQHRHSGRLRKYRGTCASTPIPLPPSPSTVTPAPHTPRYWETHSRAGVVVGGLLLRLVLEVGVGEESQVDSECHVFRQHRSWCVSVWSCGIHRGSICTSVWQQGEEGKCYTNTMSDTRGTQATFHYGVVLDVGKGRLAFIDLNREVVLAKVDVEWSESLLPMFGVGQPDAYTVNMKVISGADITMTDTKKSLIYDALN